eukprot:7840687-Alexandrium_andersonii.AAC.1
MVAVETLVPRTSRCRTSLRCFLAPSMNKAGRPGPMPSGMCQPPLVPPSGRLGCAALRFIKKGRRRPRGRFVALSSALGLSLT